jgi:ubiquinone biosynthesis O-methyltransferase
MVDVCERTGDLPELGPDAYRRWRASEIGAITERLERRLILEMLGNVDGLRVLDVGCGDGELACELATRGATVTGVDSSGAMIEAAKYRSAQQGSDIAFQVSRAENLPFRDDEFDVVTAITILCFVKDAAPVFREIARVLRPGGRFVIGELGKWSIWAAARRIRAWLGSPLWRLGRFRTARELRRLAESAGLGVEEIRGAVYYPRFRLAAQLCAPYDAMAGRLTTVGAGFIAVSAAKPQLDSRSGASPESIRI